MADRLQGGVLGRWFALRVNAVPNLTEPISNFLMERGSAGLHIEEDDGRSVVEGYFEERVRGSPQAVLTALQAYVAALRAMDPSLEEPVLSLRTVEEEDWEADWRSRFGLIRVTQRMVIRPSWEPYAPTRDEIVLIIDPKMAFGTGEHPTTRICLRALEDLVRPGFRVLDVGAGTAVLSIAAAKLGAGRVLALDVDENAVANGRDNVVLNGTADQVEIARSTLDGGVSGPFDLVVANIQFSVIVPFLGHVCRVLDRNGTAFFSGLLKQEERGFRTALEEEGFSVSGVDQEGEWIGVRVDQGI